ncbi:hypothetical protein [Clostridium sp. KNHs205]|jgi:hypothetical protein|uniref:hypothetical protein n=1 Tax=Clostridium sp. KNHs205 TaxID=1449050 RepID=UPI00051AB20E|nr:hypothetical protein [Clostridium sp. KNHs205]
MIKVEMIKQKIIKVENDKIENKVHMAEQIEAFGVEQKQPEQFKSPIKKINANVTSIGVDGCKGGWITAALKQGVILRVSKVTGGKLTWKKMQIYVKCKLEMKILWRIYKQNHGN